MKHPTEEFESFALTCFYVVGMSNFCLRSRFYPNRDKKVAQWKCLLLALPTKARILVFRFVIEYSSLRGFWPLGNRSIFI